MIRLYLCVGVTEAVWLPRCHLPTALASYPSLVRCWGMILRSGERA